MDLVAARTNARVSVQALARRFEFHLHVPRVLRDHAPSNGGIMARFGGGSVGHSAATMAVPLIVAPCQRTESHARTLEVKFGASASVLPKEKARIVRGFSVLPAAVSTAAEAKANARTTIAIPAVVGSRVVVSVGVTVIGPIITVAVMFGSHDDSRSGGSHDDSRSGGSHDHSRSDGHAS